MFGAAKSTLSEDIDILRGVFAQFHLGQLDTVTGAAGGVPLSSGARAGRRLPHGEGSGADAGRAGARSAGRFHLYGRYSGDAGRGGADGHDHCLSILPRGTGFRPDDGDEGHSDCDDDGAGTGRADGHCAQRQQGLRRPGGEYQLSVRFRQPGGDDEPFPPRGEGRPAGADCGRLHARRAARRAAWWT